VKRPLSRSLLLPSAAVAAVVVSAAAVVASEFLGLAGLNKIFSIVEVRVITMRRLVMLLNTIAAALCCGCSWGSLRILQTSRVKKKAVEPLWTSRVNT
jgi:hypothetical protein